VSRQRLTAAALLAGALAAAGCASTSDKSGEMQRLHARALYEQGIGHYARKEAAPALQSLREAIALDGTVAAYHHWLGRLYLDLMRPDLAEPSLKRAIELDPQYADALMTLGTALDELGRPEEAVEMYRKAIALPLLTTPHLAYHGLGLALYHLKRYREAEDALRFAIGLEPQMAGAFYNLGLVFVAEQRTEDAKVAFRRARDLAPQSPFGQAAVERLRALGDGG
jgi:Tfp pilus assembly protein PilF